MKLAEFGLLSKCKEFLALASKELALPPTPLLLRFFSTVGPLSAAWRPGGLPLPLRFSPTLPSSVVFCAFEESIGMGTTVSACRAGTPSCSFGGDPELPNILFSRPPWEEKLLRLLPATLLTWGSRLAWRLEEGTMLLLEIGGREGLWLGCTVLRGTVTTLRFDEECCF